MRSRNRIVQPRHLHGALGENRPRSTKAASWPPSWRLKVRQRSSGSLPARVRTAVVSASPLIGNGGKRADRLLHLGSQCGELLRTLTDLLGELRAELCLLLEHLRDRLRSEGGSDAERCLRLGEARLEDVTGHRVVEACETLQRAEALMLRLAEGSESVPISVQPNVPVDLIAV